MKQASRSSKSCPTLQQTARAGRRATAKFSAKTQNAKGQAEGLIRHQNGEKEQQQVERFRDDEPEVLEITPKI